MSYWQEQRLSFTPRRSGKGVFTDYLFGSAIPPFTYQTRYVNVLAWRRDTLTKILVIGERANLPKKSDAEIKRWRGIYNNLHWSAAMFVKMSGGSLLRLRKLIKKVEYDVVNILPPDNKCGTWDKELAEVMASLLPDYLYQQSKYAGVVLMGRRVTDLFRPGAWFGERFNIGRLPVLE